MNVLINTFLWVNRNYLFLKHWYFCRLFTFRVLSIFYIGWTIRNLKTIPDNLIISSRVTVVLVKILLKFKKQLFKVIFSSDLSLIFLWKKALLKSKLGLISVIRTVPSSQWAKNHVIVFGPICTKAASIFCDAYKLAHREE